MKNYLANSALISTLVISGTLSLATGVAAQNRAGALLFGALVGGAIVAGANQNNQNNQRDAANNAQRAENRQVQTALNYFDFNAGTPDGVFGRNTRSAISELQAFMSFPVTGELSAFEKEFLLGSYHRAEDGGAATTNAILNDPNGARGLLLAYLATPAPRENALGDTQMANSLGGAANDFGSGDGQNAAPVQAGVLPVFVTAPVEPSMDTFCSNANGAQSGIQAEFCNLRAVAVNTGDRLATSVQGATRAEISAQCLGFAPTMASYADAAGGLSAPALGDELRGWAASTGVAPESLEGIAKVCLGVGYASDNSELALASLLALIGLEQPGYSELLGYHLAFGLGFDGVENQPTGAEWLDTASIAFASGDQAINGQDGDSRAILVSGMAGQLRGIPAFGIAPTAVPVSADTNSGFFTPLDDN